MAEAMQKVRETLGDDAIIVSTKEEDSGVRVTAAIEENDFETIAPKIAPVQEPSVPKIRTRKAPEPTPPTPDDVIEAVADALLRHGAPINVTEHIISTVVGLSAKNPHAALAEALGLCFKFKPLSFEPPQKPIMLVGLPGAGKTISIAKMLAASVLKGVKPVVFSTDSVRAGATEKLAAFTKLMRLNMIIAEEPETLADGLKTVKGQNLVLIDSAGRNPFDDRDMDELHNFIQAGDIEPVLVMPAGLDAYEAAEVAEIFAGVGVKRLMPVKLDTSRRIGGVLAAADQANLAFTHGGNSGKVSEGLVELNSTILADILLSYPITGLTRHKKNGTHA
jgi:flagellar biosynthesis protein FlhF